MAIARSTPAPVARQLPIAKYDADTDTLFFRVNDRQSVARHLADELWLLVDAETAAPVGLFVEDFQRVFLKRHPDLELAWRKANRPIVWRLSKSIKEGFVRVFFGWLNRENREVGAALCPS